MSSLATLWFHAYSVVNQRLRGKMKFAGTKNYVSTDDLTVAVNAAIALERPLIVKGEPGTGKTELARQVAQALNLPIIEWNIK